jgi:chorismate dehydratase
LKPLRIGCVKYLNALPLIRGWPSDVEFDHPSVLCKRLANGELDVALVSSFEFLRNPIYRIVAGVSISSDGPVYSVVVAHHGEFSNVDEIQLDPTSETSVNLLRCLLAELKLNPRLIANADLQSVREPSVRGRLLIGDQAIRLRRKYPNEFRFWDLGEKWQKLMGVPFVYALWLIRPEVRHAKPIAQRLRQVRDENVSDIDEVVADAAAGVAERTSHKITREFLRRYYRKHLRFSFGEKEKQGLQRFANLCAKHGVLPRRDCTFSTI